MFGCVEALPFEPEVMLQVAAVERPGEPGFVRPVESERLALERREQLMRTIPIRSGGRSLVSGGSVPEHERRAPASHGQRQHRPDLLERAFGAKPLVAKAAGRDDHAIVQTQPRPSREPRRRRSFRLRGTDCGIRCCRRRTENRIESRAALAPMRSMAAAPRRAAGQLACAPKHARAVVRRCAWSYTIAHLSRRTFLADDVCNSVSRVARR